MTHCLSVITRLTVVSLEGAPNGPGGDTQVKSIMSKKKVSFVRKNGDTIELVTKRVTPSVAAPGDTNPIDATAD